jgi:membrane protease YdiL (CAAX protease family)
MNVKPSVKLAIGISIAYVVVWIGTAALTAGDNFSIVDAFSDLDNSRPLVYGLIAGALFGVVVTTVLGWWKAVVHDTIPVRGWLRRLPLIMLVLILATTDYANLGDIDGEVLVWIIVASILVGFSEELTFRGLNIVSLRGAVTEKQVWVISSVLFGLLHLPNIVLGAPVAGSVIQVVLAAIGGTMFYVVRRATGTIFAAMVVHSLWDFTLFSADETLYGTIRLGINIGLFIAVIATRHLMFDEESGAAVEGA